MSIFKKIEKYVRIKKFIISLTIILVIIDTILAFVNPAYLMNSSSLIGLAFSGYSLMKEYESYRIEHKEMSKTILIFSLIVGGFSLYHILLNLLNISGAST